MKKLFAVIAFCGLTCFSLWGQTKDSVNVDPIELSSIQWPIDSLLPSYHYPPLDTQDINREALNTFNFAPDSVPRYSPEVIAQRLKDIGSPISMDYNEYVQSYINLYTLRRREQVHRMLGLKYIYFPMFEAECDRQGVPMELKYLPVVESALNPHAVSRAGATGLWQFMLATGKLYKLDVTSYVDERKDPLKATQAAVSYLKNMYKTYGDWLLVIAAYNCGPGNVNKAIRRSGGKRTFWEIRDNLPRETRGYVPAFIAATYTFNYASEHNLFPKFVDFNFDQDTLHFTRRKVSLADLAEVTGTDYFMLRDLNPELKTHTIPYSAEPYPLRVPNKTAELYASHGDSINKLLAMINPDTLKSEYANSKKVSPIYRKSYASTNDSKNSIQKKGSAVLVYHKVRPGDVVSTIAERYHVSWVDIKKWNNLRGYSIKPGQKLKIYMPQRYAKNNGKTTKSTKKEIKPVAGAKYHKVRSGDTLWDISNAYKVPVDKIKTLNGMKSSRLQVGQMVRVQ